MAHHHSSAANFGAGNRGVQVNHNAGIINTIMGSSESQDGDTCEDILFLTDPDIDRMNLIREKRERVPGTCEWILSDTRYLKWLESGSSSLCLTGGPGKGKSFISIFLTQELERRVAGSDGSVLIFFFCSYKHDHQNNGIAILRGLLYQLIQKQPNLAKHAGPYLGKKKRQQTLASLAALWEIFLAMIHDPQLESVFCLIDGLDECDADSRLDILELLSSVFPENQPPTSEKLKLLVVSREIISQDFVPAWNINIDVESRSLTSSDVNAYIEHRMDKLSKLRNFDKIRPRVHAFLRDRSEGTFLWIGMVVEELRRQKTCEDIDEVLKGIPAGLFPYYARMLSQIEPRYRERCVRILRWVAMASRPLTLSELSTALGTTGSHERERNDIFQDHLAPCGHLLNILPKGQRTFVYRDKPPLFKSYTIVRAPKKELQLVFCREKSQAAMNRDPSAQDPANVETEFIEYRKFEPVDKIILLVHQSLREFLISGIDVTQPSLRLFKIEEDQAHEELANDCLAYFSTGLLQTGWSCFNTESVMQEYPFLHYAALSWLFHVRNSPQSGSGYLDLSKPFFGKKSNLRLNWFLSYLLEKDQFRFADHYATDRNDFPVIHMACMFGLTSWVDKLLSIELSEDPREFLSRLDDKKRTPIQYAIEENRENVVRKLLELGVMPEAKDFVLALDQGNREITKLLIAHGNVDSWDNWEKGVYSPLMNAVVANDKWAVCKLLEAGADINRSERDNGRDHEVNASKLVDMRALDIALHLLDDEDMVNTLLDHEGITYPVEEVFSTAAKKRFDSVAVKLVPRLLDDAEPFGVKEDVVKYAFETAIVHGLIKTTECLIKHSPDGIGRIAYRTDALNLAIASGEQEITKLLLANGVEGPAYGDIDMGTLCDAALKGNGHGIDLLLREEPDLDLTDEKGRLSLVEASKGNHVEVIQILLEHGADVNMKDQSGTTALMAAAQSGNAQATTALLEGRALPNLCNPENKAALHLATIVGHKDVKNSLARAKADLRMVDNEGKSVLQYAKEQVERAKKQRQRREKSKGVSSTADSDYELIYIDGLNFF